MGEIVRFISPLDGGRLRPNHLHGGNHGEAAKTPFTESDTLRLNNLAEQFGLRFKRGGMIYRFQDFTAVGLDQSLGYVEGYDRAVAAHMRKWTDTSEQAEGPKMSRKRFGMLDRYGVTVECADDLSTDERTILEAWFETEISLLQKKEPGYTPEEALRWECEALGIDPATQEASEA